MRLVYVLVAVLSVALRTPPLAAQADGAYRVVVNAANPVTRLSRDEVSRLFLKKVTSWQTGKGVVIVDQKEDAEVRRQFTREIHGRQVASVKSYWQQMIFAGHDVPPPEKASDAEVLSFVAANPNAIGYVSAAAAAGPGVKVVEVTR